MAKAGLDYSVFHSTASSEKMRAALYIFPTDAGIELRTPSASELVPRNSITRIAAFKRDLFARDLLCLAIETERRAVFELNEDMDGWLLLTSSA